MRLDMTAVDRKLIWERADGRHFLENALPDTALGPTIVTVVKAGGTSRQRHPVFNTCRMPEMTVRSSTRGFPGLPCGRWGFNVFHASSDSQNRFLAMPHLQRLKLGQKYIMESMLCMGSQPRAAHAPVRNKDLGFDVRRVSTSTHFLE
jgi:hypothetical protein